MPSARSPTFVQCPTVAGWCEHSGNASLGYHRSPSRASDTWRRARFRPERAASTQLGWRAACPLAEDQVTQGSTTLPRLRGALRLLRGGARLPQPYLCRAYVLRSARNSGIMGPVWALVLQLIRGELIPGTMTRRGVGWCYADRSERSMHRTLSPGCATSAEILRPTASFEPLEFKGSILWYTN